MKRISALVLLLAMMMTGALAESGEKIIIEEAKTFTTLDPLFTKFWENPDLSPYIFSTNVNVGKTADVAIYLNEDYDMPNIFYLIAEMRNTFFPYMTKNQVTGVKIFVGSDFDEKKPKTLFTYSFTYKENDFGKVVDSTGKKKVTKSYKNLIDLWRDYPTAIPASIEGLNDEQYKVFCEVAGLFEENTKGKTDKIISDYAKNYVTALFEDGISAMAKSKQREVEYSQAYEASKKELLEIIGDNDMNAETIDYHETWGRLQILLDNGLSAGYRDGDKPLYDFQLSFDMEENETTLYIKKIVDFYSPLFLAGRIATQKTKFFDGSYNHLFDYTYSQKKGDNITIVDYRSGKKATTKYTSFVDVWRTYPAEIPESIEGFNDEQYKTFCEVAKLFEEDKKGKTDKIITSYSKYYINAILEKGIASIAE